MKFLVLLSLAAFLAVTPVYLYESLVAPELTNLAGQYSNYDQVAQDVAAGKPVNTPQHIEIPTLRAQN